MCAWHITYYTSSGHMCECHYPLHIIRSHVCMSYYPLNIIRSHVCLAYYLLHIIRCTYYTSSVNMTGTCVPVILPTTHHQVTCVSVILPTTHHQVTCDLMMCSIIPYTSYHSIHIIRSHAYLSNWPGSVAESVEHWARVREIVGSNPGQIKPLTYQINTCRFLAR